MDSFSVLIGGKAGDGITEAGRMIGHVLNRLGYRLYQYVDSPSLIRGGHNVVIVRAHRQRVGAHRDHMNVLVALNQETIERHTWRLKDEPVIIYDSEVIDSASLPPVARHLRTGVPIRTILAEEEAPPVMLNTAILGAFCKALSIPWTVLEDVIVAYQHKKTELNLRVARRGYDLASEKLPIQRLGSEPLPILNGLQAAGLGLVAGGLKAYAAYPMTPSSGLLHFLAEQAPRFELKVSQPEGEIAAMLMALGHAYAGERVAVGTSGGGFSLMVEGLSLAGQAELPIVIVLGQRTGPSTGLPTYTAQSDLEFAISAGQGEFPRAVIAPGDVEQAYAWSRLALDLAWRYQLPVILLGDRTLNDNAQSFLTRAVPELPRLPQLDWDGAAMDPEPDLAYKRYALTEDGVSPLAFPGRAGAVVKVNSYTHDEWGITTEDPGMTVQMQDKWLRKGRRMADELDTLPLVNVYGDPAARRTVVTWGSPTGALREIGELAGVRIVQPVLLWPFPVRQLSEALAGSERVAVAEVNATGQLASLMERYGLRVDARLNRYDGRPWGVGELRRRVEEVLA
ncbi:MAG TPA: 2-oxoacid:acceptor oxidoreductase subunit alpha [Thermoleophilia bacterium]|nr:2-oxoacid:acceptor oxidoreductase subunit alpha [Thermoleophilia bacterium]